MLLLRGPEKQAAFPSADLVAKAKFTGSLCCPHRSESCPPPPPRFPPAND